MPLMFGINSKLIDGLQNFIFSFNFSRFFKFLFKANKFVNVYPSGRITLRSSEICAGDS